jgi:predicted aspartyl protease
MGAFMTKSTLLEEVSTAKGRAAAAPARLAECALKVIRMTEKPMALGNEEDLALMIAPDGRNGLMPSE